MFKHAYSIKPFSRKQKPVWMARVDGLPESSGGQDSHEEDVGEEGEVGEHQEGVEFHLAWFLLNLSQSWPFAKT